MVMSPLPYFSDLRKRGYKEARDMKFACALASPRRRRQFQLQGTSVPLGSRRLKYEQIFLARHRHHLNHSRNGLLENGVLANGELPHLLLEKNKRPPRLIGQHRLVLLVVESFGQELLHAVGIAQAEVDQEG